MADDDLLADVLRIVGRMSFTDIVRLQDRLSGELKTRFGRQLAVAFSDIVGSTPYFEQFGNEEGRKLQQRHHDLVQQVASVAGGRIVDTAGDGAFVVFPTADAAADAFIDLQKQITRDNAGRQRAHQLEVRLGFHFGAVLTDGQLVSGEAVNLAARVAGSGAPGEIRLTKDAFRAMSNVLLRVSSRSLGPAVLKGITDPVDLFALEWRDRALFPDAIRIKETGAEVPLPSKDAIAFGRQAEQEGLEANDVVLALPDETATRKISRWHFELRRHADGIVLRQVSDRLTEVDGQVIAKGGEVPIRPGSVVRASRVITLEFVSRPPPQTFETRDASFVA